MRLNTKAVARRFAREKGRPYPELRLIVAHMGSGITVSAHRDGQTIDSNTIEEGPFGPDRTGGLPARALIKLCFSGKFAQKEMDRQVFGDGGLFAYLGTRDLQEVERAHRRGGRAGGAGLSRPWSTRSPKRPERWPRCWRARWTPFC